MDASTKKMLEDLKHIDNPDVLRQLASEISLKLQDVKESKGNKRTARKIVGKKGSTVADTSDRIQEMYYEAITLQIERILNKKSVPISLFKNTKSFKAFDDSLPFLLEFLESCNYKNFTRVELFSLINILAECVCDFLVEKGIPISVRSFCYQCENFAGIFNMNFPSYIRNGLVKLVLSNHAA